MITVLKTVAGPLAHLVEHWFCTPEVRSSNLLGSTKRKRAAEMQPFFFLWSYTTWDIFTCLFSVPGILKNVTIRTALKHLFIPHEHNDYKPHFFREVSIFIIILIIFFMLGVSAGSSFFLRKTVLGANVTADVLVDLTNESRLALGDNPLSRNDLLDKAATLKGDDMATYGYFSHNSPTGVTPWHWFQQVGYNFLYAGENLAINFTDATEVRDAWLASPTHRANLLDKRFREIGMATISGMYQNEPTIYVVQLFGTPATTKTSSVEETPLPQKEEKAVLASSTKITGNPAEIKGVTQVATSSATTTSLSFFTTLLVSPKYAIVKNNNAAALPFEKATPYRRYSTWLENALFGSSYYVDILLKGLFGIVFVALIVMLAVEIERRHWKHAVYGMSVLVIILLSIIVNQMFW